MYFRIEAFGYFVEIGATKAPADLESELEEEQEEWVPVAVMDGRSPEPIDDDDDYEEPEPEHSVPLGFGRFPEYTDAEDV